MPRIGARLPGILDFNFKGDVRIGDLISKAGTLTIYGGKVDNKALTIKDGSTVFLTINPDNSETEDSYIEITGNPAAPSERSILSIKAAGTNWQSGSSVLLLNAEDPDINYFKCKKDETDDFYLLAGGYFYVGNRITLDGEAQITTLSGVDLLLKPGFSGITQIGDQTTSVQGLVSSDDLFVSGKLEVFGVSFFDSILKMNDYIKFTDNRGVRFGEDNDGFIGWSTAQLSGHCMIMGVGDVSKNLIITKKYNCGKDHYHDGMNDPTLFIHSYNDPGTISTEWISFRHNRTNGVIQTGKGVLELSSSDGPVDFNTANLVGSTVTHDAYVELEVGGVLKKFMLGS